MNLLMRLVSLLVEAMELHQAPSPHRLKALRTKYSALRAEFPKLFEETQ